MKKLMVAALGISLLSGTAVFAQNTSTDTAGSMSKKKKKSKKTKSTDTTSTASATK